MERHRFAEVKREKEEITAIHSAEKQPTTKKKEKAVVYPHEPKLYSH
jgi:hypothetical protein